MHDTSSPNVFEYPEEKPVPTISLKVPETLAIRLEAIARRRGVSKSTLIRSALEAYLQTAGSEAPGSALAQAADLTGVLSGPKDLSTCAS